MKHPECLGCQIAEHQVTLPGGDIWRNDTWHLAHDARNVVPGFLVLGTIPHVTHLFDIPDSDFVFGWRLLRFVRQVMAEQYALTDFVTLQSDSTSGHFHIWSLPLYPEMRQFGHAAESLIPFLMWAKENWNSPEKVQEIEDIAATIRAHVHPWADSVLRRNQVCS